MAGFEQQNPQPQTKLIKYHYSKTDVPLGLKKHISFNPPSPHSQTLSLPNWAWKEEQSKYKF